VSATDAKTDVDTLSVDTSRGPCLDGVQQSSSGHPGTPDRVAGLARRQQVAAAGG
jgi:transketolase